jgi:exopolysaccharide biosynthesis WecB/TagA/CpsF family protein
MNERILIVQLADIGDLVLATPALAALREARPDAHLTLLAHAHSAALIEGTGLVDALIVFEREAFSRPRSLLSPALLRRVWALRGGRYDTVLFLHHFTLKAGTLKFALIAFGSGARRRIGLENGNGWFLTERLPDQGFGAYHQAEYWLRLVALLGASSAVRPAQVASAPPPLPPKTVPRVVIHAGSGGYSLARRWDAAKFAAVAERLRHERGAEIVLVGGAGDDTAAVQAQLSAPALDISGKTTLPQLVGVLHSADVFVGADSGVMHLAAAAGAPVVAVFGPSNAAAWGAWTPHGRSEIVRSAPECSPCSYVGHAIGLREGCAARTCMRMVTPEQVTAAALRLLDGVDAPPEPLPKVPVGTKRARILGLPVDAITYAEWLEMIGAWVKGDTARHVCTINPEFAMIAQDDVLFKNILLRADLCVPDGVGLLWAGRRLGTSLPERVTGSDGLPIIAERAAWEGWRLFMLGAAPGIAQKAADVLRARYPGVQIVGVYAGSPAPSDEDALVERVNASGADILFVAYGAPVQDKWIARNLPRLRVKMAMGVGGSFDFVAGIIPRAPLWMRQAGLEWLYRLYLQPWRARRMLRLPRFVWAVLTRGQHG